MTREQLLDHVRFVEASSEDIDPRLKPQDHQQLWRLRVSFVKAGRLALLSHLEIARSLERVVRRAGLPFAISQGFSPHMKIAFGAALPVGVGSNCEIFDLSLRYYIDAKDALEALQAVSAPDLMCIDAYYVEVKAPAASAAYPYSTYEAHFSKPLISLHLPKSIEVVRKRKTKELILSDYIVGELIQDGCKLNFQLKASNKGSLRVDVLMQELLKFNPHTRLVRVTRTAQSQSALVLS